MSYVLQFFIAAVATVTFAILFAAPKKELVKLEIGRASCRERV